MNTVVVMPVSESPTRSHEFKAVTIGGREMLISVTAMKDMSEAAVLNDVRKSLAEGVEVSQHDEPVGIGTAFFIWIIACAITALVMFFGYMVATMAGLISNGFSAPTMWPDWVPMVGGLLAGTGLVRIWMLCGLVLAFLFLWLWKQENKRD